jgi:hypothetical protein
MLRSRANRSCRLAATVALSLIGLGGCAVTSERAADPAAPTETAARYPKGDPIGKLLRELPAEGPAGPSPQSFVGRPVANLDAFLGAPALKRREGTNEFRRYNLDRCRAYAIVVPAGGNVTAISTGPLRLGDPAPTFEQCTAGRTGV